MSDCSKQDKPHFTEHSSANDKDSLSSVAGLGSPFCSRSDNQEAKQAMTGKLPPEFHTPTITDSSPRRLTIDENGKISGGGVFQGGEFIPGNKFDAKPEKPEPMETFHDFLRTLRRGKHDHDFAESELHQSSDRNPLTPLLSDAERKTLGGLQTAISHGNFESLKEQLKNCPADKLKAMVGELNRELLENKAGIKLSITHNGNVSLLAEGQQQALEINPQTGESIIRGVHRLQDGSIELSGEVLDQVPTDVLKKISNQGVRNINLAHGRTEGFESFGNGIDPNFQIPENFNPQDYTK